MDIKAQRLERSKRTPKWKRWLLRNYFNFWVLIPLAVLLAVGIATTAFASSSQKPANELVFLDQKPEQYIIAKPATTTTTLAPVTTKPAPPVATQPPSQPVIVASGDIWDRLAQCESGGRWDYNGGSGFDGGLQFSPATWTRLHTHWGANTGYEYAWQAPREVQIQVAILNMQVSSGAHSQWPVCSREIGMPNKF